MDYSEPPTQKRTTMCSKRYEVLSEDETEERILDDDGSRIEVTKSNKKVKSTSSTTNSKTTTTTKPTKNTSS